MIPTEISADTRAIADLLIATPIGETATLAAMSKAIGRDVAAHRHLLASARRIAQREAGCVFITLPRIGYRRLPVEEVARVIGTGARRHVRRTAGRARRSIVAATSRANDLPLDVQRRIAAEVSSLALVEHLTRDAVVEPKADGPTAPTPVAVTARAMLDLLTGAKKPSP